LIQSSFTHLISHSFYKKTELHRLDFDDVDLKLLERLLVSTPAD